MTMYQDVAKSIWYNLTIIPVSDQTAVRPDTDLITSGCVGTQYALGGTQYSSGRLTPNSPHLFKNRIVPHSKEKCLVIVYYKRSTYSVIYGYTQLQSILILFGTIYGNSVIDSTSHISTYCYTKDSLIPSLTYKYSLMTTADWSCIVAFILCMGSWIFNY